MNTADARLPNRGIAINTHPVTNTATVCCFLESEETAIHDATETVLP